MKALKNTSNNRLLKAQELLTIVSEKYTLTEREVYCMLEFIRTGEKSKLIKDGSLTNYLYNEFETKAVYPEEVESYG